MIKLVLIELFKILKKRSIFVMFVIILLFNLLNNILFYTDYDNDGNYKYSNSDDLVSEKKLLENKLLDLSVDKDISSYISVKTELDLLILKEKYKYGSWQYNKINDYLYNIVEDINIYTYKNKDDILLKESKYILSSMLDKFDNNDWKYFVGSEIKNLEMEIIKLEDELKLISDDDLISSYNISLLEKSDLLKELKYRLDNNILYDNSYLNMALVNYKEGLEKVKYYEEKLDDLSFKEMIKYKELKSDLEINKYILINKQNYNKQNNLNYQLRTIVDDYEIFIVVIILMVAGGLVAEEFTSGTIKLLLIKPYSRCKILLSKYFAGLIIIFFSIIYLILLQLLIGGYIFSFSSLDIPVIVYDFNISNIVCYNVFVYMFIRIMVKIPFVVIIYTFSFSLSSIINNVASAVIMPLFIYMFTDSIKYLITQYNINVFKYLINVNWDFGTYLFGNSSVIEGIDFKFSSIVWISYLAILILVTIINFKNRDIKNV